MIKNLIDQLISGETSLSQTLTKTKLIHLEIGIDFSWLNKELEGYGILDKELPEYRRIYSPVKVSFSNGYDSKTIEVKVENDAHEELKEFYMYYHIIQPISLVEENIRLLKKPLAYTKISKTAEKKIEAAYAREMKEQDLIIEDCFREIPKSALINIIEQTKQRLITHLHQLSKSNPELNKSHKMENEQNHQLHNVNVNNIYTGTGTTNIAAGIHVAQYVSNGLSVDEIGKLKELGVSQEEVAKLKDIIESKDKDKPSFREKFGKWIGSVSASLVAKGISENIPSILELLHKHM